MKLSLRCTEPPFLGNYSEWFFSTMRDCGVLPPDATLECVRDWAKENGIRLALYPPGCDSVTYFSVDDLLATSSTRLGGSIGA